MADAMPPVPCPDCMVPTEYVGDAFLCGKCGQAFTTPNGMDLSMWQELWDAWTAGRALVALPAPDDTTARLGGLAEWSVPGGVIGVYGDHSVAPAVGRPVYSSTEGGHMTAAEAEREGVALIAAARFRPGVNS